MANGCNIWSVNGVRCPLAGACVIYRVTQVSVSFNAINIKYKGCDTVMLPSAHRYNLKNLSKPIMFYLYNLLLSFLVSALLFNKQKTILFYSL